MNDKNHRLHRLRRLYEHLCNLSNLWLKNKIMNTETNYNIKFAENGKLKLLIIVGTRPEIIRLAAVINKCRKYFDVILAHTGQNYDYNLNGVFFKDLKLADPEVYLDAVGDDLGATMGNIIDKSYKLMVQIKPDAVLVLGDTNSCLSVIGAKRLHIPIFHMEAGNRCFDECLPEETNRRIVDIISDVNICYSEHARRYLNASSVAPQRTYVSGSPMAEVLKDSLNKIEASDIHEKLGLKKIGELQSQVTEVNILPENFNVGYLNTYKTKKQTRIAIVPVGHKDGYNITIKELNI